MDEIKAITEPARIPYQFMEAWNRYDAQQIAYLFVEDADFINVTGKWWQSQKDIFIMHDFGLRVIFQDSKMEVLKVKIKMLSEEIAVVHARIKIVGQTSNQDLKAKSRETMFLFVAQKQDGFWKCVSAQNTDIIEGKQTNIRDEEGNLKAVSYKERIIN